MKFVLIYETNPILIFQSKNKIDKKYIYSNKKKSWSHHSNIPKTHHPTVVMASITQTIKVFFFPLPRDFIFAMVLYILRKRTFLSGPPWIMVPRRLFRSHRTRWLCVTLLNVAARLSLFIALDYEWNCPRLYSDWVKLNCVSIFRTVVRFSLFVVWKWLIYFFKYIYIYIHFLEYF